MTLTDLLSPDRIVLGIRAADKAHALTELAKFASAHLPIDNSTIYTALAGREELGSTGFGRGFALPHVRISGVERSFGLLLRLATPIAYDAIDRKPVDVLFMLLSPEGNSVTHVAALAAISRGMRAEETLRAVRKAGSPVALMGVLTELERLRG